MEKHNHDQNKNPNQNQNNNPNQNQAQNQNLPQINPNEEFDLRETAPRLGGGRFPGNDRVGTAFDLVEQMHYLFVRVVKAKELPKKDDDHLPNPYVELQLGNFKGNTKHFEDTCNPEWNQVFAILREQIQATSVGVFVKDKNGNNKDHIMGKVSFDVSEVPKRVPPDSPLAPQWYRLDDKEGKRSQGELMLAVWMGTQADEAFPEAWHLDAAAVSGDGVANIRSKNKVLVDWTQNDLIASMTVQNQRRTQTCWAFTAADVISCNYISDHPLVKSQEESVCSPEELIEWVYSVEKLKSKKVSLDGFGSYRGNARYPLSYARKHGISLLANYAIKFKKRKLEANLDEIRFREMRMSKGPRIFVKGYNVISPDGDTFSIELVTKILSQGVVYGSINYCDGLKCSIPGCKGFQNFEGDGIYEEPPHPADFEYGKHSVTVLRVGNRQGKDYLHIRNSFGLKWGNRGYADLHIKSFRRIFQIAGTEKKELKGEKWV